jgi:hypothetical protein
MAALALSEACVRCARRSAQLHAQSCIDGSFATFDCFLTQYLFASLVVLAISSILDGQDEQAGRDAFEEASRLLRELKEAGDCVVHEYCHHIGATEAALSALGNLMMTAEALGVSEAPAMDSATDYQVSQSMPQEVTSTAGIPWTESSLQQLLSQPALDMQFLEHAVRDTWSQGIYRPDHDYDS